MAHHVRARRRVHAERYRRSCRAPVRHTVRERSQSCTCVRIERCRIACRFSSRLDRSRRALAVDVRVGRSDARTLRVARAWLVEFRFAFRLVGGAASRGGLRRRRVRSSRARQQQRHIGDASRIRRSGERRRCTFRKRCARDRTFARRCGDHARARRTLARRAHRADRAAGGHDDGRRPLFPFPASGRSSACVAFTRGINSALAWMRAR